MLIRIFVQSLWLEVTTNNKNECSSSMTRNILGWDDVVSKRIETEWLEISSQLHLLSSISIPRHLFDLDNIHTVEIHGFCDASQKGYGAVFYIRSLSSNGVLVRLLSSRSRVAPIKKRNIPKLELPMWCRTSSPTVEKGKTCIFDKNLKIDEFRLWCDTVVK